MEQLAYNFKKAYPKLAPVKFMGSCDVAEPENIKKGEGFQRIEFTGFDGVAFPHKLANVASRFARSAGHCGVLGNDCDGIVLFEKDGQKYMLFCELKSTFSTDEIAHAKDQLVGSYVNMKGLLSTLQGYGPDDYKAVGLIVSFEPTQEQLTSISQLDDRKAAFAIALNSRKIYQMPDSKCNRFFSPLSVGDFDIYYVAVPNRQKTYSVDINTIIK